MRVYEKVRTYLDLNGIQRCVVAEQAGIPIAVLRAMLDGTRAMYADDLRAICAALRVSPEVFIQPKTA